MKETLKFITESPIYITLTILSTPLWIIYPCREWLKEWFHSKREKESIKLKLEKYPKKTILIVEKHTLPSGQITDYGIRLRGQKTQLPLAPWKNSKIESKYASFHAPTTFTDSKKIPIEYEALDALHISKNDISHLYIEISSKKYEIEFSDHP